MRLEVLEILAHAFQHTIHHALVHKQRVGTAREQRQQYTHTSWLLLSSSRPHKLAPTVRIYSMYATLGALFATRKAVCLVKLPRTNVYILHITARFSGLVMVHVNEPRVYTALHKDEIVKRV